MIRQYTHPLLAIGRRLVVCASLSACAVEPVFATQTDSRRELTAVIKEAIVLLERKDYVAFMKTFVRPEELKEMLEKHESIEVVAREFGRSEQPSTLLKALEASSKIEPTFSREGTRADYVFEAPIGGERRLSFQKIGDRWFLRD
jgi:hypothetical protein